MKTVCLPQPNRRVQAWMCVSSNSLNMIFLKKAKGKLLQGNWIKEEKAKQIARNRRWGSRWEKGVRTTNEGKWLTNNHWQSKFLTGNVTPPAPPENSEHAWNHSCKALSVGEGVTSRTHSPTPPTRSSLTSSTPLLGAGKEGQRDPSVSPPQYVYIQRFFLVVNLITSIFLSSYNNKSSTHFCTLFFSTFDLCHKCCV